MSVLIVESPAKAKTIAKYLGSKFEVLASFGHVRDLLAKNGSVDPDNDFAMKYEVIAKSKPRLEVLAKAVKKTDCVYLATDPDREGEAIAWHVVEALVEKKALSRSVPIKRVIFNEITKSAVTSAISSPRDIDMNLVNAQQARRALDYLVGFTLSPLLWRKLPGSRSAGRVQSVALRIVCEREDAIEKFVTQEYWSLKAEFLTALDQQIVATFNTYNGEKIDKFFLKNAQEAEQMAAEIRSREYSVSEIQKKQAKRNPSPPFITSSLQQEAFNKLGFSTKSTMIIAQKLYEGVDVAGETVGLITYMRTDGFYIADEAISAIRQMILKNYGDKYLPQNVRKYAKKVKNAQEAHEAIRPTDVSKTPDFLRSYLSEEQLKLYDLIWRRTLASQMESALIDQVVVDISSSDSLIGLHVVGSTLKFDGFYRAYVDQELVADSKLPPLSVGESCKLGEVLPKQHFTEPPPRYSEASLVKKMEEVGIGRPSTYSAIISVLQDRDYIVLKQKRLLPSERGRVVTAFLMNFFDRYVEYDFTANLEKELDSISDGRSNWKDVLKEFWSPFVANVGDVAKIKIGDVLSNLDNFLANHLFDKDENGQLVRLCPSCHNGQLGLNISRNGMFLGCSAYPECRYVKEINGDGDAVESMLEYPRSLGVDENSQQEVWLKKGPYGIYLQLGDDKKSKKIAITKEIDLESLNLETALKWLSLPYVVGIHPDGGEVKVGTGRYGNYVLYNGKFYSLNKEYDIFSLDLQQALTVIAAAGQKVQNAGTLKELGKYQGENIGLCKGRYGLYLKWGNVNVPLPKKDKLEPEDISFEYATRIIDEKNSR